MRGLQAVTHTRAGQHWAPAQSWPMEALQLLPSSLYAMARAAVRKSVPYLLPSSVDEVVHELARESAQHLLHPVAMDKEKLELVVPPAVPRWALHKAAAQDTVPRLLKQKPDAD